MVRRSVLLLLVVFLGAGLINTNIYGAEGHDIDQRLELIMKDIKKIVIISHLMVSKAFNKITKLSDLRDTKITEVSEKLDRLLDEYITANKTKEMPMEDVDAVMNTETVQHFINAYNLFTAVGVQSEQYPILLNNEDFKKMPNKDVLGAALFIQEMTVFDYGNVLAARFNLAAAAKNIDQNKEKICDWINTEKQIKNLEVSKNLTSFDFARSYDRNNKRIIEEACGNLTSEE